MRFRKGCRIYGKKRSKRRRALPDRSDTAAAAFCRRGGVADLVELRAGIPLAPRAGRDLSRVAYGGGADCRRQSLPAHDPPCAANFRLSQVVGAR